MANTQQTTPSLFETEEVHVYETLKRLSPETLEYWQTVTSLEILSRAEAHKTVPDPVPDPEPMLKQVLPDIIRAVGSLVGIGMIIGAEYTHPLATKALGFVLKR